MGMEMGTRAGALYSDHCLNYVLVLRLGLVAV
jgi:hypothetical protein